MRIFLGFPAMPLLIDDLQAGLLDPAKRLAYPKPFRDTARPGIARLSRDLRSAKVFSFSDDFSRLAVEVSRRPADVFRNALNCARAPFERVWVEWDERVRVTAGAGYADDAGVVNRVGYLIERHRSSETVFICLPVFHGGNAAELPLASPVGFAFNTEGNALEAMKADVYPSLRDWEPFVIDLTADEERKDTPLDVSFRREEAGLNATLKKVGIPPLHWVDEVIGLSKSHRLPLAISALLGGTWVANEGRNNVEALRPIYDHFTLVTTPTWPLYFRGTLTEGYRLTEKEEDALGSIVRTLHGDARYLVAALSLIQTEWTSKRIAREGGKPRMIRNHFARYMDVHECILTAPRERIVKLYDREMRAGSRRRRHEVIGHWMHRYGTGKRDCVHDYKPQDDGKQECLACGRVRWWRADCERGDATLGFVSKMYRVQTPEEQRS